MFDYLTLEEFEIIKSFCPIAEFYFCIIRKIAVIKIMILIELLTFPFPGPLRSYFVKENHISPFVQIDTILSSKTVFFHMFQHTRY